VLKTQKTFYPFRTKVHKTIVLICRPKISNYPPWRWRVMRLSRYMYLFLLSFLGWTMRFRIQGRIFTVYDLIRSCFNDGTVRISAPDILFVYGWYANRIVRPGLASCLSIFQTFFSFDITTIRLPLRWLEKWIECASAEIQIIEKKHLICL